MPPGIGREFVEKTQYQYLQTSDQKQGLPRPSLELDYDKTLPTIDLPAPADLPRYRFDLRTAIENRRSTRTWAQQPLTLAELSFLLWCTQGVKEIIDACATLRTTPSAGARHAFETYLSVNDVEGLEPGLYRFLALLHKLIAVKRDPELVAKIADACLEQSHITKSAVTFIWTAVAYRMTWRYVERGYRYLFLDAGHVCQNLYLAAEAIDAGVCAVGAFEDEDLNNLMEIDGEEQFAIYLATVGKKEP